MIHNQIKRVLQLQDGRYLKSHQYSQGHHDFEATGLMFDAHEVDVPGYALEHLQRFYPGSSVVQLVIRVDDGVVGRLVAAARQLVHAVVNQGREDNTRDPVLDAMLVDEALTPFE